VIRREFRQFEASWYDGEKIRLSRSRVDRLGYFKEVGIETLEIADAPDQVDLLVTVVEKPLMPFERSRISSEILRRVPTRYQI
jgi:outer membrane protein insertion porin family